MKNDTIALEVIDSDTFIGSSKLEEIRYNDEFVCDQCIIHRAVEQWKEIMMDGVTA